MSLHITNPYALNFQITKLWKLAVAPALLAALMLPAKAQTQTYQTFKAQVPFEFEVGNHKEKAGTYELIVVGPGLMVVRDAKAHVLARLLTRSIQRDPADVPARMVFESQKGKTRLSAVWMANNAWGLEILGDEIAMRTRPPASGFVPIFPPTVFLPQAIR